MNASRSVTSFTSITTSDNGRDKHSKRPFVHVIHGPAAPAHKSPLRPFRAGSCRKALVPIGRRAAPSPGGAGASGVRQCALPTRPGRRSAFAGIELTPAPPSAGEQGSRSDHSRRWAPRAGSVAQVAKCAAGDALVVETCNCRPAGTHRSLDVWLHVRRLSRAVWARCGGARIAGTRCCRRRR
jgi:hypothetical protein